MKSPVAFCVPTCLLISAVLSTAAFLNAQPKAVPGPHFSDPPTDREMLVSAILPQPLAPGDGTSSADEDRALAKALLDYRASLRAGATRDAVNPFTQFLEAYSGSRWRAALYLNLGIIYRQTGHMSKALAAWQTAWDLSKASHDLKVHALADYSVGQLAEFEAYLGRMETLAPLLDEVKGRPMHGAGAEYISNASQGLAEMRLYPEDAFRCGPMALHRILMARALPDKDSVLLRTRSTTRGTSLLQVWGWAKEVGLNYQIAYRQPGAAVLLPAVMHWKVGHYAAIIKEEAGRYEVEDPTFGENIRVSRATLDEEGSGYFLVPDGTLPQGWRAVAEAEGERIWGRGYTSSQDPQGTSNKDPSTCNGGGGGMCVASVELMVVSLSLHDVPLQYQVPKGPPMQFELYYSQRDLQQPAILTTTNFGPQWTSNWITFFTDNTSTTGTADLYMPGGGGESYTYNSANNTFAPGLMDEAHVSKITGGFTRTMPDGSVMTYAQPYGTNMFSLSTISDPQGNNVTLTYDASMRITAITDAAGEKTTLTYGLASDPLKVTQVTDPFGRSASFTYNSSGQLTSITDALGITSQFTYLSGGDFISALTTPYGTSTFTYGDSTTDPPLGTTRFVTLTDPLGQTERVEFHHQAPGVADSDPANAVPTGLSTTDAYLSYRNTFYWDKHQLPLATNPDGSLNYNMATIFHFLHDSANINLTGRVLESIRPPLENRMWFNYPGQSSSIATGTSSQPTAVARVQDDGTTQLFQYQRDSFGHITQFTDPIGRQLTFTYASNSIDLLSIANTTGGSNQLLWSATYNTQHEPLAITDASGQKTKFTYNSAGQPLTETDALKETTRFTYGTTGLLLSATGPLKGATIKYAYDGFNRVSSVTDPLGYQVKFSYDAADRLTTATYPDGTTQQLTYQNLDLLSVTDRLKRTTQYRHDALRRLTQVTDALGRATKYAYCNCDSLSLLTDPNLNVTSFNYDLEGRMVARIFPDSSQQTIGYENTSSRLQLVTDPLGQTTFFTYNADDTLQWQIYLNPINPTAAANFAYDPVFPRMVSMTDGTGTTTYSYNPIAAPPGLGAGLLASVTGPQGDVVHYQYDALGRAATTTVDGSAQKLTFDALGRVISEDNALDTFTFGYLGATSLPASTQSILGPSATYAYFSNLKDDRLKSITNLFHSGSPLSALSYSYDADGEALSAVITRQGGTAENRGMKYDAAGQVLSVNITGTNANQFAFTYDQGSNRHSEKIGSSTTHYKYNNLNELLSPGPATYDAAGEPLTLGNDAFQWDGAHRLLSATASGNTTTFAYDGLGRRTRITQQTGGTTTSDKFYFWCGDTLCLETDAADGNAITKRYLSEGVQVAGKVLYYTKDRLESVGELVDQSNVLQASYEYDPYGVRSKLSGAMDSDFGFAGLFHESHSGFDLAQYRAYDAPLARWLTRDPIGESGGVNFISQFIYASGATSPDYMVSGGVTYRISSDPLGSSVVVVNTSTGAIAEQITYDEFGNVLNDANPGFQPFGFAGGLYDQDTKLVRFGASGYNPNIGTTLFDGGDTNLYGYVLNDPVNLNDPFGLSEEDCDLLAPLVPSPPAPPKPHKHKRNKQKQSKWMRVPGVPVSVPRNWRLP
jgi:RHS repeat-associated protein